MIKSILLRNFQAHSKLFLEFPDGVSTIHGATDSGKSAIVRALRWVALNKPGGTSFVSHGKKTALVRITLDDGSTITRQRGKENTYRTVSKDGKKQKFKSFGTGVPKPVQDMLRLSPINFQSQHDPPFWLSQSAGEMSRQLNAVVNLEEIDRVLGKAASCVRKSNTILTEQEKRVETAKKEWKETDGIVELDVLLKKAEGLEEAEWQAASAEHDLCGILTDVRDIKSQKGVYIIERDAATHVLELSSVALTAVQEMSQMSTFISNIEKCKSVKLPPSTTKIENYQKKWMGLDVRAIVIEKFINQIEYQSTLLERKLECVRKLKKEMKAVVGTKCPLCGNRLQ